MGFDELLRHTLTVKRMVIVTAIGPETVGGADTTLDDDTLAGVDTVTLANVTGVSPGDLLRVGDAGEYEVREVDFVDGSDVTFTTTLDLPHDSGDQVREVDPGTDPVLDDYGQPVMTTSTVATVAGLIQPRSAREVALASQEGAALGRFVGYMRPLAGLTTRDWIEKDGVRFDIVSVPDAAGLGHHLELGLEQVS